MQQPTQVSFSRRALLAAPCAALLASGARPAACPQLTRRPLGDMIGLGVKFSQGQPMRELDSLLELRVRWVRDAVHWPVIEPSPGRYAGFDPAFARQLEFYKRHDIGLVALLTLGNPRAYPGGAAAPYDPQAFGGFALHVAQQLRAAGVRFVLEIGNEPHNSGFAKALGGAWNGHAPSPWVDHYVRMVDAAVRTVKGFDPSIKLLTDDDLWVVHYWYLQAGLPRALDGFAVHPYTPGPPERAAVAHDTDWTRPFSVVDADRSFGSAVRRLREQGRDRLDCTPAIWITEWGWAAGGGSVAHAVPEPTLVAYLPRAFVVAAAAGVEVLCWFSAQDTVDGPMGLTRNDGSRRDSYHALRTLASQLGDHTLQRQAAGAATPTTGLQAFVFEAPSGRRLAVWSADGQARRLPWTGGATGLGVDALGKPVAIQDGPTPAVAIGPAPIYLDLALSDVELDARLAAAA
ncbi:MAG: hypothetical protein ACHP83_01235 [Burkholderiales bacterium]